MTQCQCELQSGRQSDLRPRQQEKRLFHQMQKHINAFQRTRVCQGRVCSSDNSNLNRDLIELVDAEQGSVLIGRGWTGICSNCQRLNWAMNLFVYSVRYSKQNTSPCQICMWLVEGRPSSETESLESCLRSRLHPKWHYFPLTAHYYWPRPIGIYVENRALGTQTYSISSLR